MEEEEEWEQEGYGGERRTGLGQKEMPIFHGGTEKGGVDPLEFLADFEQHAKLHRWDEETKVGAFQQSLKGARG